MFCCVTLHKPFSQKKTLKRVTDYAVTVCFSCVNVLNVICNFEDCKSCGGNGVWMFVSLCELEPG